MRPFQPAPLSANALTVLEKRYLVRDEHGRVVETPDQMFRRVARAVAAAEDDPAAWEERFYRRLAALEFLPNSPALMNAGRDLGQLAACFVVPVEDSMGEIFDAVKWASLIQMTGGGTGFSFSRLRPAGDRVSSTGGAASGPLSFMDVFNTATDAVKQGGTRRGANMAVLRVDHPDIEAFLEAKRDRGRLNNFNVSVAITDEFMQALERGEDFALKNPRSGATVGKLAARPLWDRLAAAAAESGEPGILFIDRINAEQPTPALGLIEATNPCVVGDTRVRLEDGAFVPISELVGQEPTIATFDERLVYRQATRVVASGEKPILRLTMAEGPVLRLTAEHRVATAAGDVPAGQLRPGDRVRRLLEETPPPGRESDDARLGELHGWLAGGELELEAGDGPSILPRFVDSLRRLAGGEPTITAVPGREVLRLSTSLRGSARVPEVVWRGGAAMAAGYLRGLCTRLARVERRADEHAELHLAADAALLRDVQLLAAGLGIPTTLGDELVFPDLARFSAVVGFLPGRKAERLPRAVLQPLPDWLTVAAITSEPPEPVFDLEEPTTRHFFADGILVHNCGEQPLLPFESCVLGSIDLARFARGGQIDWPALGECIHDAVRFLDDVVEVTRYPLPQIEKITRHNRKIGLGVMGLADLLIALGIAYDSEHALAVSAELAAFLEKESLAASAALAEERGAFQGYADSRWPARGVPPLRNATTTTVAPTGTISIIAGCSSGIEPLYAIAFTRHVLDGATLHEMNPAFARAAAQRGFARDSLFAELVAHHGARGLPGVPDDVAALFPTAHDVPPEHHVRMQAVWQRHCHAAVSKTVNLPRSATAADVERVYRLAWELGCKGVTVYRDGSRTGQVLVAGGAPDVKDVLSSEGHGQ